MIILDGSHLEGGGALVRTALALSTLTGKEFQVTNIRAGRPNPGLKAQHLTAINLLKKMSNAETNEISLGTTELHFKPGKIKRGIYECDIGTAGSISLLLQAVTLPCLFASGKITIKVKGGTCGKWQASVSYLQNVLLPQLRRFVEKIELKIIKQGYFPIGGGEVHLEITPRFETNSSLLDELPFKVAAINLTKQGEIEQVRGVINLSRELEEKMVAMRIESSAKNILSPHGVPINIRTEYVTSQSVGGEILLWAIFSQNNVVDFDNPVILAGDALIEKNKKSEDVGKEAAENLQKEIGSKAAVDHYLADQLIPYMALLPGSSILPSEISQHTKTNIYVTELFLPVGYTITERTILVEKNEP
ncbi:MAG: RNA 3'-terminal phosphate cyclase [archaeon]|nr:RNA 3'-terminal phosphate cyclase [archaeon]